ncbi:Prolyl 4-hydroxylase subunit alpha-2 [Folsomia candida]|uniref:Prolyl 4-hydroxylase subunit alpha-2 n=1 Tax=Folsomia candida TaxID=158441 RepID=A0A226DZ40_FOLCA|nr:Prolyl 4-hydroxylase subunit alpha-2 [Folsomia candida]
MLNKSSQVNNLVVLIFLVSVITSIISPCYGQWGTPSEQALNKNNQTGDDDGGNANAKKHKGPEGPMTPLPYALSSTYLTYLARTEMELYKDIKNYAKTLKERLAMAEAYLTDYEDSTIKGTEHLADADEWTKASQVSSNPLMSYRMVRRFANEFDVFGAHVNQYLEGKLVERVNKLGGQFGFPGDRDCNDGIDALLRLHYVYDLKAMDLVNGKIMDVETHVGLTPSQSFKIAEYSARNEYYTLALDWLKATEYKIKELNDTTVSAFSLANTYKRLIEKHDRDFEKNRYQGHLYMFSDRISTVPDAVPLKNIMMEKYRGDRSDQGEAGHYAFLALCNGDDFLTPKERSKLYCWIETKRHPYFTIRPLRMELIYKDPEMIQFHDIIPDAWIKDFRKAAMPTLQRAPAPNSPGATPRTAIYAWLEDGHIPDAPIARRMELMFNLNVRGMNASEALQIASYAFGGHVSTHYDSLGVRSTDDPIIAWKGDRVSTYLVYLNNVEKGGLTAFPIVGTHIKPIKGTGVYWYGFKLLVF